MEEVFEETVARAAQHFNNRIVRVPINGWIPTRGRPARCVAEVPSRQRRAEEASLQKHTIPQGGKSLIRLIKLNHYIYYILHCATACSNTIAHIANVPRRLQVAIWNVVLADLVHPIPCIAHHNRHEAVIIYIPAANLVPPSIACFQFPACVGDIWHHIGRCDGQAESNWLQGLAVNNSSQGV